MAGRQFIFVTRVDTHEGDPQCVVFISSIEFIEPDNFKHTRVYGNSRIAVSGGRVLVVKESVDEVLKLVRLEYSQ